MPTGTAPTSAPARPPSPATSRSLASLPPRPQPRSNARRRRTSQSSASVTGRRASSPPSDHPVAGLVLPSVVGTGPPHHAVRREPAGQSKARGAPGLSAPGTTHGLTGSRVPATGPRRGGTARPRPEPVLLAPAEVGGVRPHALQDARQLARQRHLRPLHAAAPGHLQGPPPEGRDASAPGQHRVRGLVQRGAHRRVTDLADPAGHVGLARP